MVDIIAYLLNISMLALSLSPSTCKHVDVSIYPNMKGILLPLLQVIITTKDFTKSGNYLYFSFVYNINYFCGIKGFTAQRSLLTE